MCCVLQVTIVASACVLSLLGYLFFSSRAVYLVNFSCYKPPARYCIFTAHLLDGPICLRITTACALTHYPRHGCTHALTHPSVQYENIFRVFY